MGKSLGAQLLKAGLVNKKQVSKAKQEQYRKKKKKQGKAEPVNEGKELARKAEAAQRERTRQLNREHQEQIKQHEITAQIGQMIESAALTMDNGDLAYNFADQNRIKKIYVTKSIRDRLSTGQLAIVKHKERYRVVEAKVARKIAERDPTALILLYEPEQTSDPDDPYAEFPIPDDLDW